MKFILISRKRIDSRKGFTLIEGLITILLLTVVMGCAFALYIPGVRMFKSSNDTLHAQQNAVKTMNTLSSQLKESGYQSFSLRKTDGTYVDYANFPIGETLRVNCLCFMSAYDSDEKFNYETYSGRPYWQKFVIYFLQNQDEVAGTPRYSLYRKYFSDSSMFPTLVPFAIDSSDLESQLTASGKKTLIADDITRIEIYDPSLGQIGLSIYTASLDIQTKEVKEIELRTKIFMRN